MTELSNLCSALIGAALGAAPFHTVVASPAVPIAARDAQVVFLGEQHDNPAHHDVQASWVMELQPKAIVFEMLTPQQASQVTPDVRANADVLADALDWESSGWPDFAMYYPIFSAAPGATVYGASIPPDRVRGVIGQSLDHVAPVLTARFALDTPLPQAQQAEREALQKAAHCDALPDDMLPMMVSVQRLRDAALADAALTALRETGGPVVVITGNGHAREDWGAPFLLRQADPQVALFALGQGEAGSTPQGGFSSVIDGPAVDRGDPCDAFK